MNPLRYLKGALALTVTLSALAATGLRAQGVDGHWQAFLGCWEPIDGASDAGLLCVQPGDDGVEMFSMVDGKITTSETLRADGIRRETSAEGCKGWESAEFSDDGRRIFTHSEFTCGTDVPRSSSGVLSLVAPNEWLDVRSVDVEGEKVAWVQKYRLVGPEAMAEAGVEDVTAGLGMSVRAARIAASRALGFDQIEEATEKIDAKAVEAWIAAREERFALDADALVRLDDAGVPESVIDVMVAVSFPESFQIGPRGNADAVEGRPAGPGLGGAYGGRGRYGFRSFFFDPFYYGYSGFGYGAFGYSPFYSPYSYGYGSYGYPYGGYYYTPTTVEVGRRSSSHGRVSGRGYRRGGGRSGGASRPAGRAGPSAASSRGGASAGSSRSGSSKGGGRKAKRRGGR
jgi:hypothetical protein